MVKSKTATSNSTSDISNKAVVVALVLVVLVSVVSLGVYMRSLESADPGLDRQAQGTVSLKVASSPSFIEPTADSENGKVAIRVAKP